MKIKNSKTGQVLLISLMLVATVVTVMLASSFTSVSNTQITKLEEENQKALAAAEAGIEKALQQKSGSVNIGSLSNLGNYTGTATIDNTYNKTIFSSPLMQKNENYTFYLADKDTFTNPYNGNLTVYYGSQSSCSDIALEITVIYDDSATTGYDVKKYVADIGNKFASDTDDIGVNSGATKEDQAYNCNFPINISAYQNPKIMFIQTFFNSTKYAFDGGINVIKPQGSFVNSQATSNSGVSKKIQLFQSYPQIPSDFFMTNL
ncbi:hypothetical protein GYA28_01895 [Candidatus Roizmanbacteria bacterium]|jgi:hypothetical protein|nr:hypothetical protein [Candidatus Roizmanbacteria bacterium]